MCTARQRLGTWGEFQVFDALLRGHYAPKFAPCKKQGDIHFKRNGGDIVTRVEVKTAVLSRSSGTYRFCLSKRGFTEHTHSDYVVLVCIDSIGWARYFVIPVREIAHIKHIHIKTIETSKYAKYERKITEVAQWLNV